MRVRTNDESGDVLGEMRKSTAHTVAGWLVCPGNHLNVRQRGGWIDGKAAEDNARPRTGAGRATTQSIRFRGAKAKRGVYSRLGAWQMSKQRATPNWTRDSCTVHVHFEVHVDAEGSVYPGIGCSNELKYLDPNQSGSSGSTDIEPRISGSTRPNSNSWTTEAWTLGCLMIKGPVSLASVKCEPRVEIEIRKSARKKALFPCLAPSHPRIHAPNVHVRHVSEDHLSRTGVTLNVNKIHPKHPPHGDGMHARVSNPDRCKVTTPSVDVLTQSTGIFRPQLRLQYP